MGKKISQITSEESTSISDTDWFEGEETGGTSFKTLFSVIRTTIWNYITNLTAKTTLTGADEIPLSDSAASNVAKKITWANFAQAAYDYINSLTADTSPDVTADFIPSYDASASAGKKVLMSNFYKTINGLTEDASPDAIADFLATYDTSASGAKKVRAVYLAALAAPEGQLINGKLSPTVASNNLTLAIKTMASADPSATDPVAVKINGTVRWITSALSVTLNAGTQYFALGTAFAALEQDFFAYVSWRTASSAVVLGFARFPYAAVYSEFSATNTNEKYGAFSTAPASTDDVVVCGRFAATLSASASFNWSVPSYTSINLVQRPIYDSRIQSFVPVWASSGTQPVISDGTIAGMYQFRNRKIFLVVRIVMGASTTYGTGTYNISIPFAAAAATNATNPGSFSLFDSSAATMYIGAINLANAGTTGNLFTHGATQTSATVPITLAQSDVISVFNDYAIVVP